MATRRWNPTGGGPSNGVQCVLGMEPEQALDMARRVNVALPAQMDMQVDTSLFANNEPMVS